MKLHVLKIIYFLRICVLQAQQYLSAKIGSNITLPCFTNASARHNVSIYWERQGEQCESEQVLENGSILIVGADFNDSKVYICRNEDGRVITSIYLDIQGPPLPPANLTGQFTTKNALISWSLNDQSCCHNIKKNAEDYCHKNFGNISKSEMKVGCENLDTVFSLRLKESKNWFDWDYVADNISSHHTEVFIDNLKQNTTYIFEVCSQNFFGSGGCAHGVGSTYENPKNGDNFKADQEPRVNPKIPSYLETEIKQNFNGTDQPIHVLVEGSNVKPLMVAIVIILFILNATGTFVLIWISVKNRIVRRRGPNQSEEIELIPDVYDGNYSSVHV